MAKKRMARLPGSKANPIHPKLDSFMQRFESNKIPKNIAIMINSADNA